MNAQIAPRTLTNTASNAASSPVRRERRPRDFGIGYGSSSGYASTKRYASDWGLTRFRCA